MPKDMLSATARIGNRTADTVHLTLGQAARPGRGCNMQDFHGASLPQGSALNLHGAVLAVADGISSSRHGRAAAEMAVAALMSDYYATPETWTVRTAVGRVLRATNSWLHAQTNAVAPNDPDRGFVCTLSAMVLKGRQAHLFHVGDSRIARLTGDRLEPLTRDHRSGGMLARAMGAAADLSLDYARVPLAAGDIFVLTTDGVHHHVSGRDLCLALKEQPDLDAVARSLVDLAATRGSGDDLTVQVLRIDALPPGNGAELSEEAAELPVPSLPRAGERIDGFLILRQIHASARSHVYLAQAPDGARVALKIPAAEVAGDPAARRRFLLEDWVARRIDNAHVLRAAPLSEPRSQLYGVTEYVEGITLRQWMTDHPRASLEQMRDIIGQIATGLRALHRREMIHQDVRPENIVIDKNGTVRLIDFGQVAVAGVEEASPGVLGVMPGTFQYTAPEYLSGDVISWRADMFSLAVIAYEMLTGMLPYGTQVAQIASRRDQMRLCYRTACAGGNAIPGWIDTALARALHPQPTARPDALSEFLADLSRPSVGWQTLHRRPLAARNPVRFWQAISASLALLCLILAAHISG